MSIILALVGVVAFLGYMVWLAVVWLSRPDADERL